jgi:hypothetical protein
VYQIKNTHANTHKKLKHQKFFKYAVGMSDRHSHKKTLEYSGKPTDSSQLLEHTLDIYQIQHLLEMDQTVD